MADGITAQSQFGSNCERSLNKENGGARMEDQSELMPSILHRVLWINLVYSVITVLVDLDPRSRCGCVMVTLGCSQIRCKGDVTR
jgi:hypothetical protein